MAAKKDVRFLLSEIHHVETSGYGPTMTLTLYQSRGDKPRKVVTINMDDDMRGYLAAELWRVQRQREADMQTIHKQMAGEF